MKLLSYILIGFLWMTSCSSNEDIKNNIMENGQEETIQKAPELRVDQWIDANGKKTDPIRLADYKGKFKIIYCFQHWCPGCHSVGLPSLKRLVDEFNENDKFAFFAVQTVFEGQESNTYERIAETQEKYDLKIPFGHDPGNDRSTIMEDYNTRGTPWFIFIDESDHVIFADYHINTDRAIEFLKKI